jgi:hypothetical protein
MQRETTPNSHRKKGKEKKEKDNGHPQYEGQTYASDSHTFRLMSVTLDSMLALKAT